MYCDSDLDVGVDGLGAGDVAGLELLDQVVLDATDEADRAGLALQRGGGADEERALLLGERSDGDVRAAVVVGESSGVPLDRATTESTSRSACRGWRGRRLRCRAVQRKPTPMTRSVAVVDEQARARSARSPSPVGRRLGWR